VDVWTDADSSAFGNALLGCPRQDSNLRPRD
jgi:hypothetical protein